MRKQSLRKLEDKINELAPDEPLYINVKIMCLLPGGEKKLYKEFQVPAKPIQEANRDNK